MSPQEEAAMIAMMIGAQPQAQVHRPGPQQQGGKPQAQVQQPQQQGGGQQQSKQHQQGGGKKMKSAQIKEPKGAMLFKPLDWCGRSISWLTNVAPGGGARYVFMGLAVACFGLSTETVYTAMPASESAIEQGIENRHFLPKPAINDNANIALLNPLPLMGAAVKITANYTIGFLPFYPRHRIDPRWTVWSDPSFYLAMGIALAIQATEAIALRRMGKRWDSKMAKFQELNNRRVPDLSPGAVAAANLARAELVAEGSGGYVLTGLTILAVYGIEFFTFTRSVADVSVPGFTLLVYGLVNVFGFEVCLGLAQGDEE